MSVTSQRSIILGNSGDVEYSQTFSAADSSAGSGQNQLVSLASGNNTITVPDDAVAVTIIPASDNEETLKIKGVNGDTGIQIHPTDPTSLGLDDVTSFVINASGTATVRLIYS